MNMTHPGAVSQPASAPWQRVDDAPVITRRKVWVADIYAGVTRQAPAGHDMARLLQTVEAGGRKAAYDSLLAATWSLLKAASFLPSPDFNNTGEHTSTGVNTQAMKHACGVRCAVTLTCGPPCCRRVQGTRQSKPQEAPHPQQTAPTLQQQ